MQQSRFAQMWLECVKQDDNNTFMVNIQENAKVGANNQCDVLKNNRKLCNSLESSIFAACQIDWHFAILIDEYEYYIKSSSSWSGERKYWNEKKIVVNIVQRSRVSGVCLEQRDDRKRHRAVSARLAAPRFLLEKKTFQVYIYSYWMLSGT